jgi:hypothetical protein
MKVGETLKVRFIGANNGFIHPMHIHGGPFEVAARDGEMIPASARFLADTVNVGPASAMTLSGKRASPASGSSLPHPPPRLEQQCRNSGRRRSDGHYRGPLKVTRRVPPVRTPTGWQGQAPRARRALISFD